MVWPQTEKERERIGPWLFCGHYRRVLGSGVFIYEVNVVGVTRLSENNWDEDEVREVAWIRQLCQLHKSNLMWYFALNWGICCRVVKIETKMNCWCTFSYIKLQPKVIKLHHKSNAVVKSGGYVKLQPKPQVQINSLSNFLFRKICNDQG